MGSTCCKRETDVTAAGANQDNIKPKEYDPNFKGPIEKRSCTDVICLFMLIAFLIGWCVVAVIAFSKGDPSALVYPVDSLGQKCGLDRAVKDKPFLFFFDITQCAKANVLINGCRTPQVCVEKCPDPNNGNPWSVKIANLSGESEETIKQKLVCKYHVDKSQYTVQQLIDPKRELCSRYVLPAKTRKSTVWKSRKNPLKNVKRIFASRCIPKLDKPAIDNITRAVNVDRNALVDGIDDVIKFFNAKELTVLLFEDLQNSWHWIVGLLIIGAVLSLIWIFLMRCFAGIMVWLSLFGMIAILGVGCFLSVLRYTDLKQASTNNTEEITRAANAELLLSEDVLKEELGHYLKLQETWLAFAIITGILLFILLLIVAFLRARLFLAVALIKQGARAVSDMTFTLIWPITPWIAQLLVMIWFALVGLYLVTANVPVFRITNNCNCSGTSFEMNQLCEPEHFNKTIQACGNSNCQDAMCTLQGYKKLSKWFHVYNFFGLLWLMCFVNDFGDMVLAGCFAGWYWTFNRSKNCKPFPVLSSVARTARYHLGTIAFGSLIISIIKFVRCILEYLDHKTRQYHENPIAKALIWCMKCCFWCLEKFMKYINRNAYIMVAVYGQNFCSSARDAFLLLVRNALRAFVLDKVTDFLMLLGKLVITGSVAVGSFFVFTHSTGAFIDDEAPELNFYLTPVILVTIGTYFITSLFFSVYEMAVDTLFLCFLEDCERNDGSAEKPFYMPQELMQLLKKNKAGKNGKSD